MHRRPVEADCSRPLGRQGPEISTMPAIMPEQPARCGQSAAARFATFIEGSRFGDLPVAVTREAKRSILNFVGTCLGGQRHPAVAQLLAVVRPLAGRPEATVIG